MIGRPIVNLLIPKYMNTNRYDSMYSVEIWNFLRFNSWEICLIDFLLIFSVLVKGFFWFSGDPSEEQESYEYSYPDCNSEGEEPEVQDEEDKGYEEDKAIHLDTLLMVSRMCLEQ